jgi:hypothetical protein
LALSEVLIDQSSFIEVYNPNPDPVQLSAYGLVSGSNAYHLPPGTLVADGYLSIPSSVSGIVPSVGGGQVALTDPSGATIDRTDPWPTATLGQSWALSDGGWEWSTQPTPGAINQFPVVSPPADPAPIVTSPAISTVELSELLPNPSTALNGSLEKYIELHNSGDDIVSLDGYSLRSGANLGNHVTITGQTIQPKAYLMLPISLTHLSLAVSGSKVGLFDPAGNLVGETVSYGKAPLGQAYAHFADGWHWTTLPTPGVANVLSAPPIASVKTKAIKVKAAAKPKTTKPKAPKKAKAAKLKTVKATPSAFGSMTPAPNGRWLLFILLGLTMVYISYEFRLDLQHYYHRCRRYLASRRASRRGPGGPDDSGADQ